MIMYTEETTFRQEALENCLLKNMQQKPYSQISVSDLCSQTGISRKSFYRYFGNKDGCLYALLDRLLLDSFHYQCEFPRQDTAQCPIEILQTLAYWKENHTLLEALLQNQLIPCLVERAVHHFITEEKPFLHSASSSAWRLTEETPLFFISGYIAVVLSWHKSGYRKSVAEVGSALMQILGNPLIQL